MTFILIIIVRKVLVAYADKAISKRKVKNLF